MAGTQLAGPLMGQRMKAGRRNAASTGAFESSSSFRCRFDLLALPRRRASSSASPRIANSGLSPGVSWRSIHLLFAVVVFGGPAQLALASNCDRASSSLVGDLESNPKVVKAGKGSSVWRFSPIKEDFTIVVTPTNVTMDPDMRLFTATSADGDGCKPSLSSQEIGSDYMLVDSSLAKNSSATWFFLKIACRDVACEYHLAFSKIQKDDWQELKAGEDKSGIAYHGNPSHFVFECDEECRRGITAGSNERVTFSAWPRDASSAEHITLLVRKGSIPTTDSQQHLQATRGWFSGEVVSTVIEPATYYITVLKRHSMTPIPFVLSVKLPQTLEKLQLGKPTFGSVAKDSVAYFKFWVGRPYTDIEVYLTKLGGDPDMALSHSEVNAHPNRLVAQWRSRKSGDDEIVVRPDDEKRKEHQTGWFHVGVSGSEASTFSIIALVEPHIARDNATDSDQGDEGVVIEWTELWLGLPQTLAAKPGRPANFLFFSQLVTPKLFIQVEALEGKIPDTCVVRCGADPHMCPYLSPYSANMTLAGQPLAAVSSCADASMRGYTMDIETMVANPCTNCWYAILVTSAKGRSQFKIALAAEGRAFPLVPGESFKGSVDAAGACMLFAYDLSEATAQARAEIDSTMQGVLTPIYGEPVFEVTKDSEDSAVIFSSEKSGHDTFELHLKPASKEKLAAIYFFKVCASGSHHASFRIQVSWDKPLPETISPTGMGFAPDRPNTLGVALLMEGQVQRGSVKKGRNHIYLFMPAFPKKEGDKPSMRISVTPEGGGALKLFAVAEVTGKGHDTRHALHTFIRSPEASAHWSVVDGSNELVMRPGDAHYIAPSVHSMYVLLVGTDSNTMVPYEIEAASGDSIEELPVNGVPLSGSVDGDEYIRYRVAVEEVARHVSISLTAQTGDCDLFVGTTADVTSENSQLRSQAAGSDAVFIPAFSELNRRHCSEEVIKQKGECVYFVAVKGVSKRSDFQIAASMPDGVPVALAAAEKRKLELPPGSWQYYYVKVVPPMQPMTLEVSIESGVLISLLAKVVPSAKARHPPPELVDISDKADIKGSRFAGVWSIKLEPDVLMQLCEGFHEGCAVFVAAHTTEGVSGTVSLLGKSSFGAGSESENCLILEGGVPSRGVLNAGQQDKLCFSIKLLDALSDISLSVTPLSECAPMVEAEKPDGVSWKLPSDERLGYVSRVIRAKEHQFKAGDRVYFKVSQTWHLGTATMPATCQFDIRAQLIMGSSPEQFGRGGEGGMTALLMDGPVFIRGSHAKYFSFLSRIERKEDAAKRADLEVRITGLTGEIQVACGTLVVDGGSELGKKSDLLAEALGTMQVVSPDKERGSSQFFSCQGMHEGCGEALSCQLLVRVRSSRPGRVADIMAVASDRSDLTRSEALVPGVPMRSCVGTGINTKDEKAGASGKECKRGKDMPARHASAKYQLFINNPVAIVRLRLSCQGSGKVDDCKRVLLSADSRAEWPENYGDRAYTPTAASQRGAIELELRGEKASANQPGACRVPCVVFIHVETRPGQDSAVEFQLEASSEGAYALLLDGDDPSEFVARPSRPEYFLFDSRHPSPLLMLVATVPYDASDPDGSLVNMYVIDCSKQDGPVVEGAPPTLDPATAKDPKLLPSAEFNRYRGIANPRGQLVAMIAKGAPSTEAVDEGDHCYYRIAVVSHRLQPATITIRGFDWHPGLPVVLGEPLAGVVDGAHSFSYAVDRPASSGLTAKSVVLGLEVCAGDLRLQASMNPQKVAGLKDSDRQSTASTMDVGGSFSRLTVPWTTHNWIKVSSSYGKFASYILSAEDPGQATWLEAFHGNRKLVVEVTRSTLKLSWQRAQLYGMVEKTGGDVLYDDAEMQYEVFYVREDRLRANFSTACGMYLEYQMHHAKRVNSMGQTSVTIELVEDARPYIFNVVAKSATTGKSMAYSPWHGYMESHSKQGGVPSKNFVKSSSLFGGFFPMLPIVGIGIVAAWYWNRGRGQERYQSPSWFELPSWVGSSPGRRYQTMEPARTGRNIGGHYVPPAM